MISLYLLLISFFILAVNASPSDHPHSPRASSSIDKAVRRGSLWNPVVRKKGHHLNLMDSLPEDIIKNQIADFLNLRDLLDFHRAFPHLGIGITPDQQSLLSLLKKWNRKKPLLKSDKFNALYANIDPSFLNDYLFRWAAATGWTELAKILSNDHRVNIHSYHNWAYILAEENHHFEILELFKEFDPEIRKSDPIRSSFHILLYILQSDFDDMHQILQSDIDFLLLLETSSHVRGLSSIATELALETGNQKYIKMLLDYFVFGKSYPWSSKTPKVDPFFDNYASIFLKAIREGNLEIANLILDKSLRINPLTGYWSKTFRRRRRILDQAALEALQLRGGLDLYTRIRNILDGQNLLVAVRFLALTIIIVVSSVKLTRN